MSIFHHRPLSPFSAEEKVIRNGPRDKRYVLSDERSAFFGQLWNQWPTSPGMGSRFGMEYAKRRSYTDIELFYSV